MPRWNNHIPKVRHHRASGRAVVTPDGRDVYPGPARTPEAEAEYRRVIAEHITLGEVRPRAASAGSGSCTIDDLIRQHQRPDHDAGLPRGRDDLGGGLIGGYNLQSLTPLGACAL